MIRDSQHSVSLSLSALSQPEKGLPCSNLSSIAFIIYSVFPLSLFTACCPSCYSLLHVLFSLLEEQPHHNWKWIWYILTASLFTFLCRARWWIEMDTCIDLLFTPCQSLFSGSLLSGSAAHSLHITRRQCFAAISSSCLLFLLVIAGSCTAKQGCNAFLQIGYQ